jgi:hypothetical protein
VNLANSKLYSSLQFSVGRPVVQQFPAVTDLDERFRVMDSFDEYCHILSLSSPPIEISVDPKYGAEQMQTAK